ncbi:MAG: precorrin-3B C(17)-methyltransferase [Nitrospiraceae bacterium]|nr:precorrin-3B C(17)-methyltransferase [Nitrospiraceae bacterium]
MAQGNEICIIHLSQKGKALADRIKETLYPEARVEKFSKDLTEKLWPGSRALVFISASGIAVRAIAPFIKSKLEDPAVIVMDENGRHVISLLSGHAGGANRMAEDIAAAIGAAPVVTTATDTAGLTPIDVFAAERGFKIENQDALKKVSARHARRGKIEVFTDIEMDLPEDYIKTGTPEEAAVIISARLFINNNSDGRLLLRPRCLCLGVGLNSGTGAEEIEGAVRTALSEAGFSLLSVSEIGTHIKKVDEKGLQDFARKHGLKIRGFSNEELNAVKEVRPSEAAMKAIGANAVAEPSAILASGGQLIAPKKISGNVTVAAAGTKPERILYIIGIGPGGASHITPKALDAIRACGKIIGYKTYLSQIATLIKGKDAIESSMTEEVERAKQAVALAAAGEKVALISGGDAGVYGMAGLALDVASISGLDVQVQVIPGVPALAACASVLGAPLMSDFAAISLSDRLTPWEVIEKRLEAAAASDFVIVLYNPKSGGRRGHLDKARQIILRHRPGETAAAIVRAATRPDESYSISTLADMPTEQADMQCTVFVGNSQTRVYSTGQKGLKRMVTPRGYERKYRL